ncbi:reverse transcriptase domain-containing protein [Tanacetum coccineum]|uniref:Reverse transcriptase domain-containing protein n=1 Tax=Tanacetum coccineum TaxID=301880 RepID=A0ABQ5IRG4_9ASTR
MVTLVEKRSNNKFFEFHNDKGQQTLIVRCTKKQIEELPWQSVMRQKVTQSFDRIREITFPPLTVSKGTKGPLVIEAEIGGHAVHRMYVDGGSSMEVLCRTCFTDPGQRIKSQMVLKITSLTGFSGETIWPLGQLRLLVNIGDAKHSTKAWMNFMIVRSPSPYNGIIGRPGIREIQAVPSTAHGMIKFLVNGGIVTIRSTILTPTECAAIAATPKDTEKKAETRHKNFKVAIHPDFPDQEIAIGGALSAKGRTKLCALLKANLDIFAWQPSDMTGVPRSIAEHRLNIRDGYPPVRQKKRGQAPERAKAIQAEVQKLVEAGIMREVYYHDWLSNPVMVKKHDGSWRMCVDFTDLNKACPHDFYPLPEIDWKNAGPRTSGEWTRHLDKQGGSELELYVVMTWVIKSPLGNRATKGHCTKRFVRRRCATTSIPTNNQGGPEPQWEVGRPKQVSFQVSGKILAALQNLKEMHQKSDFHWTSEAEQAFKHLKQHISELPMLVAPRPKEELIMYLSASHGAVGAVLMTERDTIQTPVYFVSRALQGAELNYTPMEKLILALVCAAKRLRRYFQAHPVAVITDQPIKQIISRPDVAGRLQKWSVMLGEHNITYRPRTSVKGQILADFLVEKPDEVPANTSVKEVPQEPWTLFTDGSSCVDGSGAGLILTSPEGTCVGLLQADYIVREIHEGSYSMHAGPRSVVAKAMWSGYYWPTMHRDSRDMIRKCLLPEGPGKVKFLIVAMDYFTKWIEAKAVATISSTQVKKFVWDNIICRFGLPGEIVSDNGKQFSGDSFKDWVRGVTFRPGDFVYRSNDASHGVDGGKLGPKWEGPYEIMESLGDGAYKLRSTDGTVLPRTWNIANLKKCYL